MKLKITKPKNKRGQIQFNVPCITNDPDYEPGGDKLIVLVPRKTGIRVNDLTELDLADRNLTEISNSIGNLRNLTHLDLSNNQLETIPTTIGDLENLRYLNLNNNPLINLPASICNLNLTKFLLNSQFDVHDNKEEEEDEEEEEEDEDEEEEEEEKENESDEVVPENEQILLYPLQNEYIFESAHVLNVMRKVFNINEYNRLMSFQLFRKNDRNLSSTRRYAIASTEYYKKEFQTRKKIRDHISSFLTEPIPLKGNPPSSKVFATKKFKRNLESFTKEHYIPKTVREVLLLRGG